MQDLDELHKSENAFSIACEFALLNLKKSKLGNQPYATLRIRLLKKLALYQKKRPQIHELLDFINLHEDLTTSKNLPIFADIIENQKREEDMDLLLEAKKQFVRGSVTAAYWEHHLKDVLINHIEASIEKARKKYELEVNKQIEEVKKQKEEDELKK